MSAPARNRQAAIRKTPQPQRAGATATLRRLEEIHAELQEATGLPYRLVIDMTATGRLGQCRFSRREIGVSWFHLQDDAGAEDTLRHEWAHAAAYHVDGHRGHGAPWREWARTMGAEPVRCGRLSRSAAKALNTAQPPKWRGVCEGCGREFFMRRCGRENRNRRHIGCGRFTMEINPAWARRNA